MLPIARHLDQLAQMISAEVPLTPQIPLLSVVVLTRFPSRPDAHLQNDAVVPLPLELLAGRLEGLDDEVLARGEEDLVGLRAPRQAVHAEPWGGRERWARPGQAFPVSQESY